MDRHFEIHTPTHTEKHEQQSELPHCGSSCSVELQMANKQKYSLPTIGWFRLLASQESNLTWWISKIWERYGGNTNIVWEHINFWHFTVVYDCSWFTALPISNKYYIKTCIGLNITVKSGVTLVSIQGLPVFPYPESNSEKVVFF